MYKYELKNSKKANKHIETLLIVEYAIVLLFHLWGNEDKLTTSYSCLALPYTEFPFLLHVFATAIAFLRFLCMASDW